MKRYHSPFSYTMKREYCTTAQLHSTKPELRFCAGSNPVCSMLETRDVEDLWQWSRLEIRQNTFHQSTISQKQFIIIIINCHNLRRIKLLTRLRLGLSHLHKHKFKHGFQDTLNPICSCDNDIETSAHFLLYCPHYSNERSTFLNTIRNIKNTINPLELFVEKCQFFNQNYQ